jgi:hypothetical protein
VLLLEFWEKSKTSKEKLILARRSVSDLLLDLFFKEATSSIRDLLCDPRSDFIFPDKIFLSPEATYSIPQVPQLIWALCVVIVSEWREIVLIWAEEELLREAEVHPKVKEQ